MTPRADSELMNMSSKKEYLGKMRWRYGRARGRGYKSRLIEEVVALCGYSRKHAIKLLNRSRPPQVLKRSGPKARYDGGVVEVLKRCWFASDQLCGKRLKAALPHWLPHYENEYGAFGEVLRGNLEAISARRLNQDLCLDQPDRKLFLTH
jgi:hypothetical protein